MSKPHIVLVPGAWHAPFYMEALISKLEGLGYTIHARQMPAVGNPSPPKDLSEDIAALRSMVEEAISPNGNDVVVICHSWGGFVTGNGLVGLSRKEREAEGKKGGVVSLGYMTAFMISEGETLLGATGNIEASWVEVQEPYCYATSPHAFYNDLPLAEQEMWHGKLQSHACATFKVPASSASWKIIPTSYLLCEKDQALPVEKQQAMIDKAREQGADVQVTRISAGHSPFLSKVDETVGWVRGVAGEKV